MFQFFDCCGFALFKLNNADRLVKKFTAFLRLATQDPLDLSLTNDGITFLTDTGIIEKFIDIFQTARRTVEQIFTLTRTVDTSGDRHFLIINRKQMIRVVHRDRYISITERLTVLCSCKDNVLHARTTQLLGTLFTKYPADRIGNITLSTAIRSYNAGDAVMKIKYDLICEGLESIHFNAF